MDLLKIIYGFVPDRMKPKLFWLSIAYMIGMLLDLVSIGLILPFIYFITDFESVSKNEYFLPILRILGNPSQCELVVFTSIAFIVLFFLKNFLLALLAFFKEDFTFDLRRTIANNLLSKYLKAGMDFHSSNNTSFLQRNVIQLSQELARSSQTVLNAFMHLITILGIFSFLIILEPLGIILITTFLGLFALFMVLILDPYISVWSEKRLEFSQKYIQIIQESLGMIREMKVLRKTDYFLAIFTKINDSYNRVSVREHTLGHLPRLWMEFGMVLSIMILVIYLTSNESDLNSLLPLIAMLTIGGLRMIPSLSALLGAKNLLDLKKPSLLALHNEINREIEVTTSKKESSIPFNEKISFESIDFGYGENSDLVFEGLNIEIIRGRKIGIIGKSGSGKTTFLNLLLGLIEPIEGTIEIDNRKITKDTDLLSRLKIAIVPQEIFLIDSSIKENISLEIHDSDIDYDLLNKVVEQANISEFISSLPKGLDSQTGERGSILSGGQRQRIGLARALYSKPEILILDEATNSLDSHNKRLIIDTVNDLVGITTVMITHQEETLEKCDQIFKVSNRTLEEVLL